MLPDFICRKPRSITQRKFWKGTLYMWNLMHVATQGVYRIAGKFGEVNVWRIDFYKLFGEEKFGEWFAKLSPRQTFPLYDIIIYNE